jgi:hypothetical protein
LIYNLIGSLKPSKEGWVMERLDDLFKDFERIEQKERQAEKQQPVREEKKVVYDKVVYLIGPNQWEVVPCDEQGNLLPPGELKNLGYYIAYIFSPGLPEKVKISISDVEKYQEIIKKLTRSWMTEIVALVHIANSRNINKEIVFCLFEPQVDIFKLAWNTLVEFKDKKPENPEELLYKSLSVLLLMGLEGSKLYMVVGTDKGGGPKYYLSDSILLYSDGNLEKL